MKQSALAARILLGSIFVVFGLNGFLHFLPQPSMPEGAISFFGALAMTGYILPLLFGTQIVGGVLLLVGMVPLALVILAPIIVNIVAFHVVLAPGGLPLAVVVAAAALFLAYAHRESYGPLLFPKSAQP
jgi:uncharacterized membrane protein YphA (DoxX/SURF4 family)